MNIYVSPNNQKLLWKTMMRFQPFVKKYDKDNWFKNIIGNLYENNKGNGAISLKEINLHTINYMIKQLQEESATAAAAAAAAATTTAAAAAAEPYTHQDILNVRRNEFDAKLQEKENEMRDLLKRDVPAEIDFRDKAAANDAPIANIGELMKLEIEKRNRDMQSIFSAAAAVTAAIAQPPPPPPPPQPEPEATAAQSTQKRVSWQDDKIYKLLEDFTEQNRIFMEKTVEQNDKIAADLEYIKILLESRFAQTAAPPKLPEIYPAAAAAPENINEISPMPHDEAAGAAQEAATDTAAAAAPVPPPESNPRRRRKNR
jgi:hypothetical protein